MNQLAGHHDDRSAGVLLAIETSQRNGSVALRTDDGCVHVEALRESSRHDDDLMPAIDRLCGQSGVQPRDLDAVAVSIGPGGFTGLRIAVTTAKMFAETLRVRIVALPSALVAAQPHDGAGPIGIALASKRGQFWWTICQRDESNQWAIIGQPGQVDAAAVDLVGLECVLADEHLPQSMLLRCRDAGVAIARPVFRAESCLEAAGPHLKAGLTADPLSLTPLYARQPEAVSLWEKRQREIGRRGS